MTKKETNNGLTTDHSSYHKLSIQVSLNGLSFCVLDTIANSLVLSHEHRFEQEVSPYELHREVRDQLREQGVLDFSFSDVIGIHRNTLFCLVPQPLFDPANMANYLKFNAKILATDHLEFDPVQGLDTVNVYVPFTNVNNYLYDLFGEFEFKHSGTVLLETLVKLPSSRQGTLCYLHLAESQMDLVIFSNKKLVFFNSFAVANRHDILYFLLFTLEQQDLDLDTLKLRLLGEVEQGDPVYDLCAEYVENISLFMPPETDLSLASPEEGIDFTLINAL